jgi:hypothetical protein
VVELWLVLLLAALVLMVVLVEVKVGMMAGRKVLQGLWVTEQLRTSWY